jgi:hypothetical protein
MPWPHAGQAGEVPHSHCSTTLWLAILPQAAMPAQLPFLHFWSSAHWASEEQLRAGWTHEWLLHWPAEQSELKQHS